MFLSPTLASDGLKLSPLFHRLSLSHSLTLPFPSSVFLSASRQVLRYLFGLAPVKDVDLHLRVGEALADIGAALVGGEAGAKAEGLVGAEAGERESKMQKLSLTDEAAGAPSAEALPPLPPITAPKKTGVDAGIASSQVRPSLLILP